MKNFLKKLLKTVLVGVLATILVYSIFTLNTIYKVCEEYQINIITGKQDLSNLDAEKIKKLGDVTRQMESVITEAAKEEDNSIGDFFDPLGYTVWSFMQIEAYRVAHEAVDISVLLGITTALAYAVITCKKMKGIFKLILGYFAVLLIVPPIYMYTWTFRFWDIQVMYFNSKVAFFYVAYTIIFVVVGVINYFISKKMTKDLNNAVKEQQK